MVHNKLVLHLFTSEKKPNDLRFAEYFCQISRLSSYDAVQIEELIYIKVRLIDGACRDVISAGALAITCSQSVTGGHFNGHCFRPLTYVRLSLLRNSRTQVAAPTGPPTMSSTQTPAALHVRT